jgi:hypothetical protein
MRSALVIGALIFIALIVVRIPASVVQNFIPSSAGIALLAPEGTLWSGSGDLLVAGNRTGRLVWSFTPVTFLQGRVGYDLELGAPGAHLGGRVAMGLSTIQAEIGGTVDAQFVNQWLAPYHIELSGAFELLAVSVTLEGQVPVAAGGRLTWEGGPLRYRLSGKVHDSVLPPMTADLGPELVAVAHATGESMPLLHAALKSDGFARFGVTKYLTRMLGQPWPGSDPDHAVVLEVEEQVF